MEMPLTIRPARSRTLSQWLTRTNKWCLRARRTPGCVEAISPRIFSACGLEAIGIILQSSIRGLGCRVGNHENAAGCKLTVWLLDGHGVSDAAWLYCYGTGFNFNYRNTSRHGNCPGAILVAHNESRAAALVQDTI